MNLSEKEKLDLEQMNKNNFTMEDWDGFSIVSILAHLISVTSVEDVEDALSFLLEE